MRVLLGVDEAGRGPLAGPIAVAAVKISMGGKDMKELFKGIRDSKKFSEKQREAWFLKLKELKQKGMLEYAVSFSGSSTIDTFGITTATKKALSRVMSKMVEKPQEAHILLDGSLYAPKKYIHQETIIRGDDRIPIIAAASIVAKVSRDRKMKRLAKEFSEYFFEVHKGYGTKLHYRMLKKHGPSKIHRRSFIHF